MPKNNFISNNENFSLQTKYYYVRKPIIKIFNNLKNSLFILLFIFTFCLIKYKNDAKYNNFDNQEEKIGLDKYEDFIYSRIKHKFNRNGCSQMTDQHSKFLNGVIRKFKPKKVLEIGVYYGGSSIIILNAINDFQGSKLYSIDLDSKKKIGYCVNKYFPNFLKKWSLFKGNILTEFIEKIGNNIDMVLIDSAHFEPGEILDFLMVLPFLKEEAIVVFHDIALQMFTKTRNEWAPYIIFNGIRGKKYVPSGSFILKQNIGAVKLEKNQSKYYEDYFRLLGGQWQYFPKEIHINSLRNYFMKHYGKRCLIMFEETVAFNRKFVKLNKKHIIYNVTSD